MSIIDALVKTPWKNIFLPQVVTLIGFVPNTIRVDESAGQVEFNVEFIDGIILTREIVIEFFTEDESAQGIYVDMLCFCLNS